MVEKYRVLGLTVIKYVGEDVTGHNCDFTYEPGEFERVIVHLMTDDRYKFRSQVELRVIVGECGSGWTTASWGVIREVNYSGLPFTHIPKDRSLTIEFDEDDLLKGDVSNEVFNVSALGYGGDSYYPMGGYEVNIDLFEELPRAMKKRPVYIFSGDSGLGKTSLGAFSHLKVFDTDCCEKLEDIITADIVILGNKYHHTFDDVKDLIFGEYEPIFVNFSK